jgi:hypothetical protein
MPPLRPWPWPADWDGGWRQPWRDRPTWPPNWVEPTPSWLWTIRSWPRSIRRPMPKYSPRSWPNGSLRLCWCPTPRWEWMWPRNCPYVAGCPWCPTAPICGSMEALPPRAGSTRERSRPMWKCRVGGRSLRCSRDRLRPPRAAPVEPERLSQLRRLSFRSAHALRAAHRTRRR